MLIRYLELTLSSSAAELEGLLLEHPDIADAGVVGVQSDAEATELPR